MTSISPFDSPNDFQISGFAGNDLIIGGSFDDVIGGEGDDILAGSDGDDQIYGGAGSDILEGGFGKILSLVEKTLTFILLRLLPPMDLWMLLMKHKVRLTNYLLLVQIQTVFMGRLNLMGVYF